MNVQSKPDRLIRGATGDWELVIGLEVHAQVSSKSKLFSGASTEFGGDPNSHVSLVDAAMPGMLPVINAECVAQAIRTGLGLKAKINDAGVKRFGSGWSWLVLDKSGNLQVLSTANQVPIARMGSI